MTGTIEKLPLLVAKAIQSDNKGKGYFTTQEGLTDFLAVVLEVNQNVASQLAAEILKDRASQGYYYYETEVGRDGLEGGVVTLAERLEKIGYRNKPQV